MARSALLEQYRSLPLPSTQEEHWRFTDLEGFDPDAYAVDAEGAAAGRSSMLELETAGTAFASEAGIEIANVPDGVTFAPLTDHELLGTLVGAEDKFTAQNAALWQHGLLVHVPKGVEVEKPLYVRVSSSAEGGALFWRLLVVAEEGSRLSLIEEYASESPSLSAYSSLSP